MSSRQLLAPLTTTFIAPPDCSAYAAINNNPKGNVFFGAQSCSSGEPEDVSTCWPPALITTKSNPLAGYGFYSPGLICPQGFTSACTQIAPVNDASAAISIQTSFNFQFPPTAGETAIGCCPTGLTCTNVAGYSWQTCGTKATTGFVSAGICSGSLSTYDEITKVSIGTAQTGIFAPLIQIVFQSKDLPTSTASSRTDTSTPTAAGASIGTNTTNAASASTTPANSSNNEPSGLSSGAKIGIGVGIPLGALLLALLGALIFMRRRKTSRERAGPLNQRYEMSSNDNKNHPSAAAVAHEPAKSSPRRNMYEAPTYSRRVNEIDSSPAPALFELGNEGGRG